MRLFDTLCMIGSRFQLPGTVYSFEQITQGNINSTYKVSYRMPDKSIKSYMFQRLNTVVFKNPREIMKNIDNVTTYIRKNFPSETVLHFHHTPDGDNFFFDGDGSFWRVMNYIDSITFNVCEDLSVIAATGEAFGHFQMQLSGFDGSVLYETIPDFHNTRKRLDTFFSHVTEDPYSRVNDATEEIEYISSVRLKAGELSDRFAKGAFPVRVTHNDTKCNNVLFDRVTKRPIAVIDLDTVMPGMSMVDFGDAVRCIANTADEDEPDLSRVFFDTAKFRAFCKGYIGQVKDALTADEIDNMVLATFTITVELGMRFLDDYIMGDTYFKTNYPEHNLVRARCQLHLAKDIQRKSDELNFIVHDELEKARQGR
ncbi:MAG: aminoglycoside phosphotransferase family protein [Clostridia bacterium]|nr:aminoglycoside phosphotransferase family protein [Clostridia bacterium]